MLKEQIRQITLNSPEFAALTPVIEKEILHHDIMAAMIKFGAMQSLTFIGGTSLRMCHNSSRLSEDLDFNGGHDFKPADFDGLDMAIQNYIQNKYDAEVWVEQPANDKLGNTKSWKISIVKTANRPDLPRQKIHIDVCAIPSFDVEKKTLINHYNIVAPTEGLLIPAQSLTETLTDKFIALAYRSRRIMPRDIWDILWIKQRGISLSVDITNKKLLARGKTQSDFKKMLATKIDSLVQDNKVHANFNSEMSRFIPKNIKEQTVDSPDFWPYLCAEIQDSAQQLLHTDRTKHQFDMGR